MIDDQTAAQMGQPGFDEGVEIFAVFSEVRKKMGEEHLELAPFRDDARLRYCRRPHPFTIPSAGSSLPLHATIPCLTAKRTSSALVLTRSCSIMRYL